MPGNPGIMGIIVIAVVVILLFGRGKISGLMGEVASGIKSFKKGLTEEEAAIAEVEQIKEKDKA